MSSLPNIGTKKKGFSYTSADFALFVDTPVDTKAPHQRII
jgi:hypothetical protein